MNKREAKTDVSTAKKFHDLFVKRFKTHIPAFEVYKDVQFKDYLGNGAGAIYTSEILIPPMSDAAKKKAGLSGKTIQGMFWTSSDINPNGITCKEDIGRTYTIQCQYHGLLRYTQRRWEDGRYIGFYGFSRYMDTVLEEFEEWIVNTLKPFQSAIENKKYHWERNSRF